MPIGKALLLKGLGGLAVLGGAIGVGYSLYDYYSNQETKFDRGLIDFLNDGGDIQFSVKNGTSDISTDFPTFTNGTTSPTATVTIKVSVDASATAGGTNDGGTLTEKSGAKEDSKAKKTYLQNLNKGSGQGATATSWTWVCEIKFTKKTDEATANELADKDKLVKENDGFFNKLKGNNNKDLKIKFIQDCAEARGKDKNKEINKKQSLSVTGEVITTTNKIESTKEFKLRKGVTASGEEAAKLYPVDKSDFNNWFGIK